MSLSNALQTAIFDLLLASPAVSAIVGARVYDAPSSTVEAPYITFGPSDVVFDEMLCADGRIETIQLDLWSEAQDGQREVKALTDAVCATLQGAEVALSVGTLTAMRIEMSRILRDPSGAHHGVVIVECRAEV